MKREEIIKELINKDYESKGTSNIYDSEGFRYVIGSIIYDVYTKKGKKVISYRILKALENNYYIDFINFLTAYDNDEFGSNANRKVKKTIKRAVEFYNKKKHREQKLLENCAIVF